MIKHWKVTQMKHKLAKVTPRERNCVLGFLILSSPFTGFIVAQEKKKKGSTRTGHWKSGNERREKAEVQKSRVSLSASQAQSQTLSTLPQHFTDWTFSISLYIVLHNRSDSSAKTLCCGPNLNCSQLVTTCLPVIETAKFWPLSLLSFRFKMSCVTGMLQGLAYGRSWNTHILP